MIRVINNLTFEDILIFFYRLFSAIAILQQK